MYMEHMNSTRFAEKVKSVKTVILPIGSTEAHGLHCALGTDNMIPAELAYRINAEMEDEVVVAPPITYGHNWGMESVPGTINIPTNLYADFLTVVGTELVRHGFEYIIILNGHGGNIPALTSATERISDAGAKILTVNWWVDYRDQIAEIASGTGHGGEDETSMILALNENYAELPLAVDHDIDMPSNIKFKGSVQLAYPNHQSGAGSKASAAKGEQIFQLLTKTIMNDIRRLWSY
ncbi:MAG: creatininase family protein [Desulfitobacteriaceae bacterium]